MIAMENAIGPAILLRAAENQDVPFIISSWLRSNRDGPIGKVLTDTVYYREFKPLVQVLMSVVHVIVACDPERPEQVYGWICGERLEGKIVVHFAYVKQGWRGWGIARRLLGALGYQSPEPIIATFVTHIYTGGRLHRRYRVINNPWLALRRAGVMQCY